ncbi:unnamed protein product [Cochlearia groenlandica]
MASPKSVSEDKISDDLEIVSVGSVYIGAWDKKYWSSSRGKDRFPYPVGFRAVRKNNEDAYYMEIEEGAKGPLFLIRYMDESWTGQTPDIAWGKFQKTSFSSHLKIWHGKRFTCKMNGIEFFGFKNPLVQRLLRELVTNSNGKVESNSSNRVSQTRVDDQRSVTCENPNLLCSLDKPMARKKRTKKSETVHQNSVLKDVHKKPRFHGEGEIVGHQRAIPEKLHSSIAVSENSYLPSENPPQVEVDVHIQETDRRPDICKLNPPSKFVEEFSGFLTDITISSAPKNDYNMSSEQEEELTRANMVVSEGILAEPNAEDLAGSCPNATVRDSDSDSADQETAKSMFSFLLPQAIPLLKKASSKKPPRHEMSGTSQLDDTSGAVHNSSSNFAAMSLSIRTCSGDDENMQAVSPDSVEDFTSDVPIAPDSFDESHMDVPGSGHIISSPKDAYPVDQIPIAEEHAAIVNANPPVSVLDTTETKNPSSHDVSTILEENYQDEYVKKSMSIPQYNSSTDRISSCEPEELGTVEESLMQIEHPSANKEPKSTSCSTKGSKPNLSISPFVSNPRILCMTVCFYCLILLCVRFLAGKSFLVGTTPTEAASIRKEKHKVYMRKRISPKQQQRTANSTSESKSSCRNTGDDNPISKVSSIKTPHNLELQTTLTTNSVLNRTNPLGDESGHVTEQYQGSELLKATNNELTKACVVPQDMKSAHAFENATTSPSSLQASKVEGFQTHMGDALGIQVSEPQYKENTSEKSISNVLEVPAGSNIKLSKDVKINNEMEKTVELLGCYFHPMHVSSVSLQSAENEIYVCVTSLGTEDRVGTLIMYKISAKGPSKGFPSIIGHTPAILPIVNDKYGGNINSRTRERASLQFTPDGQYLIFNGNVKTPYCRFRFMFTVLYGIVMEKMSAKGLLFFLRKKEIDCSCLTCTSACFEENENALRIVQVKTGHVSLVTKLKAVDSVQCVVVCDPNYLVATFKSGNLIVWAMNSHWSGPTEDFVILANPSSCIVELKKIPKCSHLVVGHNGIGEFTIWDISKRSLVSRFASPSNMIFEFIPTSLFAWHPAYSHSTIDDHVDMILAATKLWFSKGINNETLVPADEKDTAIWLLLSTNHDSDNRVEESPPRCWRLALLVKNQVILGSRLDPRANVVGTLSGHGVACTVDGLVYLWDLSTGVKLGSLHDFKGEGVSCISSDDSGNICIASEDGQLLVYTSR